MVFLTLPEEWLSIGIFLLLLVGIPVLLLKAVDLGRALRSKPSPSRAESAAGLLLAIFQTVLALLAFGIGLAIIGWGIYARWTHRSPVSAEWLLSFIEGVFMMVVGVRWLRQVFSRSRSAGQGGGLGNDRVIGDA
jgi:hypothetical protein